MSWQAYLDNLVNTKRVKSAAIIGVDGKLWGRTTDLTSFDNSEAVQLAAGFKDFNKFLTNGLQFNGQKFFVTSFAKDNYLYARNQNLGLSLLQSKMGIIIGSYEEPQTAGHANVEIYKVREYLMQHGY